MSAAQQMYSASTLHVQRQSPGVPRPDVVCPQLPRAEIHSELLRALYPRSRFVVLFRDGRSFNKGVLDRTLCLIFS